MRRTLAWILPLLATLCSPAKGRRAQGEGRTAPAEPAARADLFVERAETLGVRFTHVNGRSGRFYMPEINGAGCAVLDYDGDGDLDLFLLQGHALGPEVTAATIRAAGGDRLLRNDLRRDAATGVADPASLRFTDVTAEAGLASHGYGFGAATGDVDNDGDVDLLVTRFGSVQLWRNQGDGTFADSTAASGLEDRRWNVAATFFDYDRDGWLDLYLGTYVDFSFDLHKTCRTAGGAQDYCGPSAYDGVTDRLLRNRGDGTFEDRSIASGVGKPRGKSLGVVTGDFDADGWIDLYVANDQEPNFLWLNRRDGTFSEEALLAGAAVDLHGRPQASMGVDAADFDDDGDEDLFMTHLATETDTLYLNDGEGMFEDVTARTGLGPPGLRYTSWGTRWFDYDNDGRLDLFVANGGVRVIPELAKQGDAFPFHEPNQLFHALGAGRFEDTSRVAGPAFELSEVSRGAAFGDLDDDGDTDLVVTNNDGPARVLINAVGQDAAWLGLRLIGGDGAPRDMLGAWVTLRRRGEAPLHRRVRADGSFASAHDPRILFGLGAASVAENGADVESVQVRWPDGSVEEWTGMAPRRYTTLRQGTGRRIE